MALSCREIISTRRMMLLVIPRDSLDSKHCFSCMFNVRHKCIEKILLAKNRASLDFEKSILEPQILNVGNFKV